MMLNYGMFFSLMGSLLVCLWLTRENIKLKKRNLELCNKLVHVNCELNAAIDEVSDINDIISGRIENIEDDFMDEAYEDYSRMAEHLACIREEEVDRAREEALLSHIEEDCDQCCQDGPDKCSVKYEQGFKPAHNEDLPSHGKIKNCDGVTIHVS